MLLSTTLWCIQRIYLHWDTWYNDIQQTNPSTLGVILRNLGIWWYLALSNFALLKHFILGRRCCLCAFSLNIVNSMDTYTPYELHVQCKCMFKIVRDQSKKQNMRSVNVHRLIIKYHESCHKYLFRNACLTYPLNFHGYPDILIIPHAFLLTCVVVILRCHCLASPGTQPWLPSFPHSNGPRHN